MRVLLQTKAKTHLLVSESMNSSLVSESTNVICTHLLVSGSYKCYLNPLITIREALILSEPTCLVSRCTDVVWTHLLLSRVIYNKSFSRHISHQYFHYTTGYFFLKLWYDLTVCHVSLYAFCRQWKSTLVTQAY